MSNEELTPVEIAELLRSIASTLDNNQRSLRNLMDAIKILGERVTLLEQQNLVIIKR